jgi:hypothetical protein
MLGRVGATKKASVVISGLLFFGSFGFAELVRLKPSSVLLEEQKK